MEDQSSAERDEYSAARWDVIVHVRRNSPFTVGEAMAVIEHLNPVWSVKQVAATANKAHLVDLSAMRSTTKIFGVILKAADREPTASLAFGEHRLHFQMIDPGLREHERMESFVEPLFDHQGVLDIAGCDVTSLAYDQVFVRAGYHYEAATSAGLRPVSGYCTVNWLTNAQAELVDISQLGRSGFEVSRFAEGFVKITTPSHPYFEDEELDLLHQALHRVRIRRHAAVPATTSDRERIQFSQFDRALLIDKRFDKSGRYDFEATISALPPSHPDRLYWQGHETIEERDTRLGTVHEGLPAWWDS